jgi:phosphoribosylaminoimidazolecarboxamide formyltransferase / IMP cyclohydrolase
MALSRALISVSDKRGIVDFAKSLAALNIGILSTGGTAEALSKAGVAVTRVSDYTGAPEIFDGRVKTLHPRIHGGILFQRDNPAHHEQAKNQKIEPIDLVVVNLYPFEATVARGASFAETIENIDIGGPCMVRAAAKNAAHVGVVVDPDDYLKIVDELKTHGGLSKETRQQLMRKAFAHTAAYDSAIASWLSTKGLPEAFPENAREGLNTRQSEKPH